MSLLSASEVPENMPAIPQSPEDIQPLKAGDKAPNPALRSVDGKEVSLKDLQEGKPSVVIFYRGGWCPYCRRHLSALAEVEGKLKENGWKILALSPDKPEKLGTASKGSDFGYELISDSSMNAAKAFGVAFQLQQPTLMKLKEYKIDIEDASGERHHLLPVPAVFLVDAKGKVSFAHTNPDYSKRLAAADILKAAGL